MTLEAAEGTLVENMGATDLEGIKEQRKFGKCERLFFQN